MQQVRVTSRQYAAAALSNIEYTELRFYVRLVAKYGRFGDVLSSQSLGLVQKKLNKSKQRNNKMALVKTEKKTCKT